MNSRHDLGPVREESTPWPWAATANVAGPALMVCPLALPGYGMCPEGVGQLYRLAYEEAVRAARPSRFEWASAVYRN